MESLLKNIAADTDFYKMGHWKAVHPDLDKLYSYAEPRVGGKYKEICFFGLQMVIIDHLMKVPSVDDMVEATMLSKAGSGGFDMSNYDVWKKVHELGYIPVKICAIPEGSIVPEGNVCFTFESTEPWFAKTANLLESSLMHMWYPTAVATRAMHMKRSIKPYFDKTSDVSEYVLPVAVNDFGYRGSTSWESAARGGAGFMIFFSGSDNIPAERAIRSYYNGKRLKSVWATEHSVALSFGLNNEKDYVLHQLRNSDPNQIISIVTDTKDQDAFFKEVVGSSEVIEEVKKRGPLGRVVWRPDSGLPITNIMKYSNILSSIFGFHLNTKDYKVIGANTGIIQGDGIKEDTPAELYKLYTDSGWAADNVIFGSGGGLLTEGLTRDTSRWAIKPSYIEKNGVPEFVQKIPASDMTKASKKGRLKLHRSSKLGYITIEEGRETPQQFNGYVDSMKTVFENGNINVDTFDNIVKRANENNDLYVRKQGNVKESKQFNV